MVQVVQLRQEQHHTRAKFTETLRQRDTKIAQLQEKLREIPTNQLSLSNNVYNNNPLSRVDDRSVVAANDVVHANPVASAVNFLDFVASIVNRTNPVANAANFINSDVNVTGYTNIVNYRELSTYSVKSVYRFDPPALLRGGHA